MKTRIVEYNNGSKTWYKAQYRKFFIWYDVPGYVEGMMYNKTFSTEEAARDYIKWFFKKSTIARRIID